MIKRTLIATAALAAATAPAFAHLNPAEHGSFMAGATHPIFGLDHILVMVAVGLWAATLNGKSRFIVPAAFLGAMLLGFGAALAGMPIPFVEPVILASVVFIGVLVALALPMPVAGVASVVGFFALFHGSAHATELGAAGAFEFAAGFALATAALHAAGLALGAGFARFGTPLAARIAGGLTALAGLWLAVAG